MTSTTTTAYLPTDNPLLAEQRATQALGEMLAAATMEYAYRDARIDARSITEAPPQFGTSDQFRRVSDLAASHGIDWELWPDGTFQVTAGPPRPPEPAADDPASRPPDPVWFLTADELAATRARIATLNARATRKGFTGHVELSATPATRSHTPAEGAPAVTLHGFDVTITGEPPSYAGWRFVAAIDKLAYPTPAPVTRGWALDQPAYFYDIQRIRFTADGEPERVEDDVDPAELAAGERLTWSVYEVDPEGLSHLVDDFDTRPAADAEAARQAARYETTGQPLHPQTAPQAPIVVRYPPGSEEAVDHASIRAGECDHCHTVRYRTTTYLVRHDDTGELKQVGRSCLKDFLGATVTPVFLDTDRVSDEIEQARNPGSRHWGIESVLTYTSAVVAAHGWTPASTAGHRPATRDLVADALIGGPRVRDLLESIAGHLDEGRQLAGRILAELPGHLTGTSGYEANLLAILRSGVVGSRHLGLAVSAVNAWNRATERHLAEDVRAARRDSVTHAGEIGQALTLTGTVVTATRIPGYHHRSPDQVLLVVDCGTAIAKTITSAAWAYTVERGDQLTLTGTVKAHDEYRGVPQTVLTRPKRVSAPTPAAGPPEPAPAVDPDTVWEVVNPTGAGPRPFPGTADPLAQAPPAHVASL